MLTDNYNEHMLAWKKYMELAIQAFETQNMGDMQKYIDLANNEYSQYKNEVNNQVQNESISFGFANYIVENNTIKLYVKNKKALKEYAKLLKEDKNLSNEYKLIQSIMNYAKLYGKENIDEYVNESVKYIESKIDRNTLNESHQKLIDFIEKNKLSLKNDISDDLYNLFEDVDFLMRNKPNLKNLHERKQCINKIAKFIDENTETLKEDKESNENNNNSLLKLEDFQKKYDNLLNEDEKDLVRSIINSSDEIEKSFNSFKNECLEKLNETISETDNTEKKSELGIIKEKVENMEFSKENPSEVIIRLITIKEILADDNENE